jgi:hypothetical protein
MEEHKLETIEKEPSHMLSGDYAVLMETNGEEFESWYYFIRVEGNEDNLRYLQDQLEQVDWYLLDDYSTFDLDLDHYVSAITAKEMTKVELNHCSFHRKFDGKLQKIDLGFEKKDKNKKKIKKTFEILGYGLIENFIDDEDIDPEDLVSVSDSDEDTDDESVSSSDDSSDEEDDRRRDRRGKRDIEETIPASVRIREAIKEKQNDRKKGSNRR